MGWVNLWGGQGFREATVLGSRELKANFFEGEGRHGIRQCLRLCLFRGGGWSAAAAATPDGPVLVLLLALGVLGAAGTGHTAGHH